MTKVLYVCRANVGRSQIAEGIHNSINPLEASSAGTMVLEERRKKKLNEINGVNYVIKCMEEIGIDVSNNYPKQVDSSMIKKFEYIIIMAEIETIPEYLKNYKKSIIWDIEDPKGTSLERHREIRDQIKIKVLDLISKLK